MNGFDNQKSTKGTSNVWKGLTKAYDILRSWVACKIGKGIKMKISEDSWIGYCGNYKILEPLWLQLYELGITSLDLVLGALNQGMRIQVWKLARYLGLQADKVK